MTLEIETKAGTKCVGTAFLALRDGIAVTAWHLIQDARKVQARFSDYTTCEVVGWVDRDEIKDIALVRLEAGPRRVARLGTNQPPVGSRACVVGTPRGFDFSLSEGLISQVRVLDGFWQYQITCPISPGNSGGPVVSAQGEVLGVVAWSEKDAQNLNFATSAAYLLALDSSGPTVPWHSFTAPRRERRSKSSAQPARDAWRSSSSRQTLSAFERALDRAAGEVVTVILFKEGTQETFTFTVPKEWTQQKAKPPR
jgi:hypothetical protein